MIAYSRAIWMFRRWEQMLGMSDGGGRRITDRNCIGIQFSPISFDTASSTKYP